MKELEKEKKLRKLMKEGYRESNKENVKIAKDMEELMVIEPTLEKEKKLESKIPNETIKEKKIFWLDGNYKAKSGYYWRGFDLIQFIMRIEKEVGEVVGISIKPDSDNNKRYSYNIEFIVKEKEVNL